MYMKAAKRTALLRLHNSIVKCEQCPRLVRWRKEVAKTKVARFAEWDYWGKPVPSFGDTRARLLVVGLAPAAHGANRTGRMFTGDRSGEWLYRSLHNFGFASRPESISVNDGLKLIDCYVTAAVRCAPPQNKPLPSEFANCQPYLIEELSLLANIRVVVALGKVARDSVIDACKELGVTGIKKRPPFKHGLEIVLHENLTLIESYHPSQQNTFTGKLTQPMFDGIFQRAKELLGN